MPNSKNTDFDDEIARNLQRAFQNRADEEVPDRFLDLIAQLRALDDGEDDTGDGGQPGTRDTGPSGRGPGTGAK